ncbi:MAG TPA: hypothetical protein VMT17_02765 [Anaeromyxobacteraceae bacterium]|nr:hypothetical protein [Anaeromyxobacteraceae bacterium]
MDAVVECTHCRVVMTSWSAPGSPTRYYQCPFCGRTWCSAYGNLFGRGVGARRVEPGASARAGTGAAGDVEDARWRELRGRAARWFARLEAEEVRCATRTPRAISVPSAEALASQARPGRPR